MNSKGSASKSVLSFLVQNVWKAENWLQSLETGDVLPYIFKLANVITGTDLERFYPGEPNLSYKGAYIIKRETFLAGSEK